MMPCSRHLAQLIGRDAWKCPHRPKSDLKHYDSLLFHGDKYVLNGKFQFILASSFLTQHVKDCS